MIVRKTLQQESKRVNELFSIAFELPAEEGPATEVNPKEHYWAAFEDSTGNMMSTFTITDYNIQFDGNSCKMGGIGGVATLPQYRRMGGIRGCFQQALPDMYRDGYDFSYLYPFSTGYYRKFGYECCVQKMQVSIHLGLLNAAKADGTFLMCEATNPMTDSIQKIDKYWESRYNMMVCHENEDYGWTAEFDPAAKQVFTYVYFSQSGEPKGYTTFKKEDQPDGRNLVCSKFFFTDKEGFDGLMNLFKSLSTDHMYVKFALPVTESMEYLFPEWAMGAAAWSIQNAGMVRVINVKNVLKKAFYIGSGKILLQIQDPQIEENNKCFAICFQDGHAVSVEETDSEPDICISISAFSALISGALAFSGAVNWLNGIDVKNLEAPFNQVFYRKPLMIADYF